MKKTVLIDTNLLLDDSNIIYKLSKEYEKILIPRTVLKELDKHKYDKNLSYSARNAISSIRQFKDDFPEKLIFSVIDKELDTNDTLILEAAKAHDAVVATKDISMSIAAEMNQLTSKLYDVVLNNIFDPYIYITVDKIYRSNEIFGWQKDYDNTDYEKTFEIFSQAAGKELNKRAWFFIFIQAEREKPYVYAHNPQKNIISRIDNIPKYLEIKIQGRIIRAQDIYQNCALYALKEAPNCLITGRWGSGKTLLSTCYALDTISNKKIFITRPPRGIDQRYDIGFFPGKKEEKMMEWLSGFTSALYYIYGNTNGQTNGNGSYNYVNDVLFHQVFEILPLNSIQGLSLLENDILMVDEVQLISVDYMSLILSRPTKFGKLILMGDLKQTYNIVKPSESGLLKLLRVLPHHSIAYVDLVNSYRSELLEVANMLQDKTIG